MAASGSRKGIGGRRPGDPDTRGDIIRSAKALFSRGYGDTSLRAVAREAGVDPALIVQFFGSKDGLFLAAMADAMRPAEELPAIIDGPRKGFGTRLASWYFGLWEDDSRRLPIQAMLLSAAAHPAAADLLRTFVTREIADRVAVVSRRKDARLRAEVVGAHLIGTAMVRYVYRIPPLSDTPVSALVKLIGPTIDSYLLPAPRVTASR